jgi:TRAP transporter 4TM/12TM fusion protein
MRRRTIAVLAVLLSLYAMYWVVGVVETRLYRMSFLLVVLVLAFLVYPATKRGARATDWLLAAASVVALGWPLIDIAEFPYRAATPCTADMVLGALAIMLILEATRRSAGWILPVTALLALLYAWIGPILELVGMSAIAHRGYYMPRIVGLQYMTLDGIFGVPLDVAATYIILFTIFGAVLEQTGAGQFFIDWARALTGRSKHGATPGRTMTTAGFLLGTVSGSGVATTVTLGSVGWPMMKRAGYPAETAGAVLAAAGIGAIISPPSMGAAGFLIAEFLKIRYLDVVLMAIIPTLLYYMSIYLMIEADARRLGIKGAEDDIPSLRGLTLTRGYLFLPLILIVLLLALGMSPFRAVFWAIIATALLSLMPRESSLTGRRLVTALEDGARDVTGIAVTCATAGIIVGVVTLTGLGLKLSGILVDVAGGSALGTVLLAALAIWLLGLAVPVTASYIIAAVTVAPALVAVGIPAFAAHMFIFYYAVLSDVSPPTALSPLAAAAITGGDPFRTMMTTWKYTLPAFLVPLMFTVGDGSALLLRGPVVDILGATLCAAAGIIALVAGISGWIIGPAGRVERAACITSGLLLLAGGWVTFLAGAALLATTVLLHRRAVIPTAMA